MVEYQVFGSGRQNGCSGGAITHLGIIEVNEIWKIEKIIDMIENKRDTFWTYIYKNGLIDKFVKIEIEVIDDKVKGKYLRAEIKPTQKDKTSHIPKHIFNNLLELPVYYYNKDKDEWYRCKI